MYRTEQFYMPSNFIIFFISSYKDESLDFHQLNNF